MLWIYHFFLRLGHFLQHLFKELLQTLVKHDMLIIHILRSWPPRAKSFSELKIRDHFFLRIHIFSLDLKTMNIFLGIRIRKYRRQRDKRRGTKVLELCVLGP